MKNIGLAMVAFSTLCMGQGAQPAQKPVGIPSGRVEHPRSAAGYTATPSDLYCSGYITTAKVAETHFVAGGMDTPYETHFAGPSDRIFIHGAAGIKEGDKLAIVRPVHNPNENQPYRGYLAGVRQVGQPYAELGYVKVLDVQNNIAITQPELSCAEIKPGDLAVPFEQRETPVFRRVALQQFTPASGSKTKGRIVMASEFDSVMGAKSIVYLNIGSDKGLKVGDYLRATRSYGALDYDDDMLATHQATLFDDTQTKPPKFAKASMKSLPRLTVGDMVVLHVHPKSATAMIMTSLQDIHVGDDVEIMDVSDAPPIPPVLPVSATSAANPIAVQPAGPAPVPPTIACVASPVNVRPGETSVITCDTSSPDNRPVTVRFTANGGRISTDHNKATLDTSETGSGPISVRAVALDDRNLSASATATVNVEPPVASPLAARKLNDLDFGPNSARVDNRAKAILDDVALKMQQDPSSTLVLSGAVDEGEAPRLATERAQNASAYLTKSKGIDSKRIQSKANAQHSRTVAIWSVPPGAPQPQ